MSAIIYHRILRLTSVFINMTTILLHIFELSRQSFSSGILLDKVMQRLFEGTTFSNLAASMWVSIHFVSAVNLTVSFATTFLTTVVTYLSAKFCLLSFFVFFFPATRFC